MKYISHFFPGILITLILVALLDYWALETFRLSRHLGFVVFVALFFTLLCGIVYFLARSAASSKDKYAFVRLIMGNMMVKLILSVAIIIGYTKMYVIDTHFFVIPFFTTYVIFTIFETAYLYRMSNTRML